MSNYNGKISLVNVCDDIRVILKLATVANHGDSSKAYAEHARLKELLKIDPLPG